MGDRNGAHIARSMAVSKVCSGGPAMAIFRSRIDCRIAGVRSIVIRTVMQASCKGSTLSVDRVVRYVAKGKIGDAALILG